MPTFPVRRTTHLLRRYLKHFMWMAGGAIIAILGLTVYLLTLSLSWTTGFLCLALTVLVARYGYFLMRARQSRRQLMLESRFMKQPLHQAPVARCLRNGKGHLWSGSHTCKALRRALELPLPRLMLFEKKLDRLYRFFRLAYRPMYLRSVRVHIYSIIGVGIGVAALLLFSPIEILTQMSGTLLLFIACFEALLWYQRVRIRRQLHSYLRGLSRWTLSERQKGTLRSDAQKPYQHDLLYNAPRWFPASGNPDVEHAA